MPLIRLLSKLPIDLNQAEYKHSTKGKQIAFSYVPAPRAGGRALDIGCGDGYWAEKIRQSGYQTTAIDQEREYPNKDADYRYGPMVAVDLNEPLPYQDEYFDLVWCSEVIGFIRNMKQLIREAQRVLKPGGTYIITTPNSFFWLHYFLKIFGLSNSDWHHESHINFLSYDDAKKFFPRAEIWGYFPYTLFKVKIKRGVGLLSPTLVIIGKKP